MSCSDITWMELLRYFTPQNQSLFFWIRFYGISLWSLFFCKGISGTWKNGTRWRINIWGSSLLSISYHSGVSYLYLWWTLIFHVQQLLVLETNLFLGGLNSYDQHRGMRLDIDNMSYEVFILFRIWLLTMFSKLNFHQNVEVFFMGVAVWGSSNSLKITVAQKISSHR